MQTQQAAASGALQPGMVPQQQAHPGFQPQARASYNSMRSAPAPSYREERSPTPPPRERSRRGASQRVTYKEDFDRCRLVFRPNAYVSLLGCDSRDSRNMSVLSVQGRRDVGLCV